MYLISQVEWVKLIRSLQHSDCFIRGIHDSQIELIVNMTFRRTGIKFDGAAAIPVGTRLVIIVNVFDVGQRLNMPRPTHYLSAKPSKLLPWPWASHLWVVKTHSCYDRRWTIQRKPERKLGVFSIACFKSSMPPSYFSREYKKLFGAPPQRDIARLRSRLEV